jgi:hypothetical protein
VGKFGFSWRSYIQVFVGSPGLAIRGISLGLQGAKIG